MRFVNRECSVRVRLTIKMKLLVLVFGVVGLTEMVSSLCLVRNTASHKSYFYQCFKSIDYLADIKKAPIDVPRVIFSNSKMKVVRDDSFARLSKYLEKIAIYYSGVEEIEDNAFRGLAKLDTLAFGGNKLRVIKSAWFEGLSNLKTVAFSINEIKHVDDNFFAILPPLESLDISFNEITCLPTASFGNFKANEFIFRQNRLTPMCQASLMDWLKSRNIKYDNFDFDYFDAHYEVAKLCIEKLPKPQRNEESLNKCIEKTTREFSPAEGTYTVKQVCESLKHTPSPFLNCTGV